jgi:hypothetical protein
MGIPVRADQDFGSVARILNLLNAIDPAEPVTLGQVMALLDNNAWKDNVRAASTANVNLADGGTAMDDVTLAEGDRILLKDQTDPTENGIYIYNGDDQPLTRAGDADDFDKLEGAVVTVDEGTANEGTTWRQSQVNGEIDTDNVVWVSWDPATPDASESVKGKIEIATTGETNTGTDDERAVTPLKLAGWTGRKYKYAGDVGDGSNTSFTITHNFNTRDVTVMVRENAGNYREVMVEKRINNVNSIDLVFGAAPTAAQYRVIIIA